MRILPISFIRVSHCYLASCKIVAHSDCFTIRTGHHFEVTKRIICVTDQAALVVINGLGLSLWVFDLNTLLVKPIVNDCYPWCRRDTLIGRPAVIIMGEVITASAKYSGDPSQIIVSIDVPKALVPLEIWLRNP